MTTFAYNWGVLEALIKLGEVTPWTREELAAQQQKFLQRLNAVSLPEEGLAGRTHGQLMSTPARIENQIPITHVGYKRLTPTLQLQEHTPEAYEHALRPGPGPEAVTPRPARLRPRVPIPPTATVAKPGIMRRLAQMLKLAPK